MLRYSSRAYGLATGVGPAGNTTVHAAAALSPNPSLRHACVDGNRKHQPSRQLYRHSQHYKGVPGHADLETSSSGPTLADGAGNSNGGGHAGNRNSRNNGDDGDSDDDGEQFLTSSKAVQPRWLTVRTQMQHPVCSALPLQLLCCHVPLLLIYVWLFRLHRNCGVPFNKRLLALTR